jgi:hypothetical protein
MDGLDVYIDDYGKPDPLPAEMLRRMVQSQALGLFAPAPEAEASPPAGQSLADGLPTGAGAASALEAQAPGLAAAGPAAALLGAREPAGDGSPGLCRPAELG